jgi:hypothetical protein
MADEYVRNKIQEALDASGNQRHDAQKLLITWAVRDPQLLLGITKPHLKAITASLIEHAMRSKGEVKGTDNGPDHFSKSAIDDLVADATTRGGIDKRKNRNLPPPKSTERQATTMRKLAAAFTRKKK